MSVLAEVVSDRPAFRQLPAGDPSDTDLVCKGPLRVVPIVKTCSTTRLVSSKKSMFQDANVALAVVEYLCQTVNVYVFQGTDR